MDYIELTQEEYDAVMESRELLEKSNFDKYVNNKANKAKKYEEISKAYRNAANSASSEKIKDKLNDNASKYESKSKDADLLRARHYEDHTSAKKIQDEYNKTYKHKNAFYKSGNGDRRTARNEYRATHGDKGQRPEEKLKKDRYLELYKAKKAVES